MGSYLCVIGKLKEIYNNGFNIIIHDANDNIDYEIPIEVSVEILRHVKEYVKTGDIMGIKGDLVSDEDGVNVRVRAKKVTFLSANTDINSIERR